MKNLKHFLISLVFLSLTLDAFTCDSTMPERWYMFCVVHGDSAVSEKFDAANRRFWKKYMGQDDFWWYDFKEMSKKASKKSDAAMVNYLKILETYNNVVSGMQTDSWEYPTEAQLVARKATLKNILTTSRTKYATATARNDMKLRWLLLEMRANMLLRNYAANIEVWNTKASKLPKSIYKEMMRNIYANAMLNTGKKVEAWNIYVDQNDAESLRWSVRKYMNLAGIKKLCAESPDAPAVLYLLQCYVNNIQDVYDGIADSGERTNTLLESDYEVYAKMDKNWQKEIEDFVTFAITQGTAPQTKDPCMWLTAAALVSYYKGDSSRAGELIDRAMDNAGTSTSGDMARRARMLIYCKTQDVHSPDFKKFIVDELRWLDGCIAQNPNAACLINARDRIYNLGLANSYAGTNDANLAYALMALHEKVFWDEQYFRPNDDHATTGFNELFALPAKDIENFFDLMRNPKGDVLAAYLSEKLNYSTDYSNDIIGTKYIAQGEFAKAIPYLEKVSQTYLNKQAIAPYAARRDYHKPAWNGWQTLGEIPWKKVTVNLKGNVKLQFCKEICGILDRYRLATTRERPALALKLGQYLYQASPDGQCWFISAYSNSRVDDNNKKHKLCVQAYEYLKEALETSPENSVHIDALFGLVGSSPDEWATEDYDYSTYRFSRNIHRDAEQYAWLSKLNDYVSTHSADIPLTVSRCDVLKQFRRHTR